MRKLAHTVVPLALCFSGVAFGQGPASGPELSLPGSAPSLEQIRSVSPALASYTENLVLEEVWNRPGLSARDRSVVTLAALISRNQQVELPYHVNLALDNGVEPSEISELITHLAFYSGWANAMSAVAVTANVFEARGVKASELPAVSPELLPLDKEAEVKRQTFVQDTFGEVSQGVVDYTESALFLDLWLRPGLKPRDRSLVTVSALISTGKVEQVPFHLNKAMTNGLSEEQASEVLTHLAFYAGWPNVFSAMPVVKKVFADRD
ncbi:carboxymuconolactone decarboxylase family protein [Salinivibrio sp. KP-1]|uniref:carboxymuconolactone decarboxylase family protein n=1 Tax=Salinivibrio sp. KP-1 TaxID=1406902 RepID=UPI0009859995|nr:carboxymuconolactone decarboxylase family protein [Salinivibrio sp. KP-1]OOE67156.1 4-carboxymuconolactone decarboxylase [Salinivibrio sp. IB868]OOE77293.1 4-carboxymuconolactone decarboxylase [Salinivibrio sp. IB870]OOE81649.1 4-carboxymuconolactone decarboxylase [Salinivibrio sp. ML198]OOE84664.1 4-carboxymuconolactone decarboxylase [Salinivibrio sp. PR6]